MAFEVIGGTSTQPSSVSYQAYPNLAADLVLNWPFSYQNSKDLAANIMSVSTTGAGIKIMLPIALQASPGQPIEIINVGNFDFDVYDNGGGNLIETVTSAPLPNQPPNGNVCQFILTDNTTTDGEWTAVRFGLGASSAPAGDLAGYGLIALNNKLNTEMVPAGVIDAYVIQLSDRASLLLLDDSSLGIALPPTSEVIPAGFYCWIRNNATSAQPLSLDGNKLNGSTLNLMLAPGDSLCVVKSIENQVWFSVPRLISSDSTIWPLSQGGTGKDNSGTVPDIGTPVVAITTTQMGFAPNKSSYILSYNADSSFSGDILDMANPYKSILTLNVTTNTTLGQRIFIQGTFFLTINTAAANNFINFGYELNGNSLVKFYAISTAAVGAFTIPVSLYIPAPPATGIQAFVFKAQLEGSPITAVATLNYPANTVTPSSTAQAMVISG